MTPMYSGRDPRDVFRALQPPHETVDVPLRDVGTHPEPLPPPLPDLPIEWLLDKDRRKAIMRGCENAMTEDYEPPFEEADTELIMADPLPWVPEPPPIDHAPESVNVPLLDANETRTVYPHAVFMDQADNRMPDDECDAVIKTRRFVRMPERPMP